jgi:hypothetical protein
LDHRSSIRSGGGSSPHPDVERIIAYLGNGVRDEVLFCGLHIQDILAPEKRFCIAPGPFADGVWMWPPDLIYYVQHYHVALPDEFVAHMRRNGWALPPLDEAEKSRLVDILQLYLMGKPPQVDLESASTKQAGSGP